MIHFYAILIGTAAILTVIFLPWGLGRLFFKETSNDDNWLAGSVILLGVGVAGLVAYVVGHSIMRIAGVG